MFVFVFCFWGVVFLIVCGFVMIVTSKEPHSDINHNLPLTRVTCSFTMTVNCTVNMATLGTDRNKHKRYGLFPALNPILIS